MLKYTQRYSLCLQLRNRIFITFSVIIIAKNDEIIAVDVKTYANQKLLCFISVFKKFSTPRLGPFNNNGSLDLSSTFGTPQPNSEIRGTSPWQTPLLVTRKSLIINRVSYHPTVQLII